MAYKSVLVHVDSSPGRFGRVRCAAELAERWGAALIGLGAETIPPPAAPDAYGVGSMSWVALLAEQVETELKEAQAQFETLTQPAERIWRVGRGFPSLMTAACAAMADVIVVDNASPEDQDHIHSVDIGQVVLTAGRPVLLVPPNGASLSGQTVVVAWKNTREARRAIADALPLLQAAKDVVLLTLSHPRDQADVTATADDVAGYLSRQGVTVRVVWEADSGDAGEQILEKARHTGADLIVCGGYGHSRFGEWAFGGVTRSLLVQKERYVLFSH